MAKAILEFDLNDPDDYTAHLRAVKSLDMALALWEIMYNTKKGVDWEIEQNKLDGYATLERVYEKIIEALDDHGIKIDDLIS